MKTLQLAITDFAVPAPRSGSIETYSGFGSVPNMGTEIHGQIQAQRLTEWPGYQAERWVTHTFSVSTNYQVRVSGRMDGYVPGNPSWIEEIKSATNPDELLRALEKNPDHPYRLQVKTYGYIHYLHTQRLEIPRTSLHVVSARTRSAQDVEVPLDLADYETWLARRLEEIVLEAEMFEQLKKRRRKVAKAFAFPFAKPRGGQLELMEMVEKNLGTKTHQLLQAPTGLGKTAGVMFPALKEALDRGQKLLYLTPKNSQHAVAEDAVKRLQSAGTKVRAITLNAKAKLCFKEQTLCNPEYCEYARDYYGKVARGQLLEKLAKKKNLTFSTLQKFGREHEVCPFELQMDALHRKDVVICDYNYVFSPRNSLARLTANGFGKKSQPNLVIDEAHNLPTRANDYFSAQLSSQVVRELWMSFGGLSSALRDIADNLLKSTLALIDSADTEQLGKPAKVELELRKFADHGARVAEFLARYLESPAEIHAGDGVVKFCNMWADFLRALENAGEEFFTTHTPSPQGGTLKITCCDASKSLREGYGAFANVVAFSATLKPFDYYSRLMGFADGALVTAEFSSPFPRERRKLLIVPQVSTKYSDREANYGKIKEGIERIVELMPGNYFAFFPSFDFLSRVARLLDLPKFRILAQRREMPRSEIADYLTALKDPVHSTLILAVQGGVFAEGVDYPGEMLIGAFIIGPALPSFDFDRELLRTYYAKKFGADRGFDYAYTYPAMAKAVQSAGRVIRSHTDRGLIVLMDRRFVQGSYVKSMPADWVGDDPNAYVSHKLLTDIRQFWSENAAHQE